MGYNEAFNWTPECCGEPLVGGFGNLAAEYWDIAFECLDPIFLRAFASEVYGNPNVQEWYNKINSFIYLFGVMAFIYNDILRARSEDICGVVDYETILAQYDLECLQNAFKCIGCKVSTIPRLFALFGVDINNYSGSLDGIGFMYIEGGGPSCPDAPIFRVF
jgi:hypothetical protein